MVKKRWILVVLIVFISLILSCLTYAATITIDSTTYTLTISSSADNSVKYYYQNITFYANYTINGSANQGQNCIISFDDLVSFAVTYNETSGDYEYDRNFSTNGTYNYNVSCEINDTLNITENGTFSIEYNFPPIFGNIDAVYNLTDYQPLYLDTGCYDVYNDSINVTLDPSYYIYNVTTRINTPVFIGSVINKTYYYFMPEWNDVSLGIYYIPLTCSDQVNNVSTYIYMNVTPRNVSLNFSYPSEGFSYINLTHDYVYCKTSDGYGVSRFYVIYYNTTYDETLYLDNTSSIITSRTFIQNELINISCYTTDIYGDIQGYINRSFTVDIIPPGIDSISAESSYTTATASWITNENTTSEVFYGVNDFYFPWNKQDDYFGTNHTITFDNLTKNTNYYYYVESCSASRLCTDSYVQSIHTQDCRYMWNCGGWGDCQVGNTMTRTCNCACESSCVGNGTSLAYCDYSPQATEEQTTVQDNTLYYYKTSEGYSFSEKFFGTNNIYLNLINKFGISEINIILNNNVPEARIVLLDKGQNHNNTPQKNNALRYYNVFSSGIENKVSSVSLVFEVDSMYENKTGIAVLRGSTWTDVPFTNDPNFANNSEFMYLKVDSNILDNNYVIYYNVTGNNAQTLSDFIAKNKKSNNAIAQPAKILKSYEEPLNIAIVIFSIIVGLMLIRIIDNYYSMSYHKQNALKKEAFIIIDKENPIERFFKLLFR